MTQRPRKIVGIQLHHSINLSDASRNLANGAQCLQGAITRTGDPVLIALRQDLIKLIRVVSAQERAATERLRKFYVDDPERFVRCRDGAEAWPDETIGGFQARCTCDDICQIHDNGRDEQGWLCKCKQCPAHPEIERSAP